MDSTKNHRKSYSPAEGLDAVQPGAHRSREVGLGKAGGIVVKAQISWPGWKWTHVLGLLELHSRGGSTDSLRLVSWRWGPERNWLWEGMPYPTPQLSPGSEALQLYCLWLPICSPLLRGTQGRRTSSPYRNLTTLGDQGGRGAGADRAGASPLGVGPEPQVLSS